MPGAHPGFTPTLAKMVSSYIADRQQVPLYETPPISKVVRFDASTFRCQIHFFH